jgi:hypothetical protein
MPGGVVGAGGARPPAAPHAGDPGGSHEPGDLILADLVPARRAAFHRLCAP